MSRLILFLPLLVLFLYGCNEPYQHRFKVGDCVQMKLSGERGMVIGGYANWDGLYVRFNRKVLVTDTGLLSADGAISSPYSAELIHDFELDRCQ